MAEPGSLVPSWKPAQPAAEIQGTWSVRFVEGGPDRPADVKTATLSSWTAFEGDAVKAFSGTAAYSISFPRPKAAAAA